MEIKGFLPTSLTDWASKTTSIVFLNRCNLRCRYCHNGELALGIEGQSMTPAYVLSKMYDKKDWIDGVVITGGEPTLNSDLPEFCRDIKKHIDIPIKIDTNGTNPNMIRLLLNEGLVDKISMDVKAPLLEEGLYSSICQANVKTDILEQTVNIIIDSGVSYEFRTTLCSAFLQPDDVLKIVCELCCISGGRLKEFSIQNFNPDKTLDPALKSVKKLDESVLRDLRHKILQKYDVLVCNVRR